MSALRDRSFPPLDASRVIYQDDDVIVVDKPPFVPTQARRSGDVDDLPTRLRAFLGGASYLGIHQRLDQATSGLIAYAKRESANAWLARAWEDRAVEKVYVAAVSGARLPRTARWEDALLEVGDRVKVVPRGTAGSRIAHSEISVIEQRGDRALVRVHIETGRTHQIRAQLAHRGAPIGGDAWYGGAPWPRLCLASVGLRIPRERSPSIDVAIDTPSSLEDFVALRVRDPRDEPAVADAVLRVAAERRYGLAHDPGTSCFRWVNDAGDGAPSIAIDVYGEHAVVHAYDERDVMVIVRALERAGVRGVYLKRRPKTASRLDETATRALAPSEPILGTRADDEIEVLENGLPFLVRLGDGLSTGLFLDQRANRARVRATSAGARVLNLFAYTCGFSIAAAAGGASEVVSVDSARKQLERGARGMAHARLSHVEHEAIADDVFAVLDRFARRGRRFDRIVCDPPTYSSTKRTRFTSGRMWTELAAKVLGVLAPGGEVLATSNDRRFSQAELRASFRDAARATGTRLAQLKDLPPPVDFPVLAGDAPRLFGVLVRA